MSEYILLLCLIAFGLIRFYWVNRVFLSLSDYVEMSANVTDSRIDNEGVPHLFYTYEVNKIKIGSSAYSTPFDSVKPSDIVEMSKLNITKENPKKVSAFYNKSNPVMSILKKPKWKWPLDGLFFVVVPVTYIILEMLQ